MAKVSRVGDQWINPLLSQIEDLQTEYLLLPSLVFVISRIRQGAVELGGPIMA